VPWVILNRSVTRPLASMPFGEAGSRIPARLTVGMLQVAVVAPDVEDCAIDSVIRRGPTAKGMLPVQVPVVLADVKATLCDALPPFPSLIVNVAEKSPALVTTIVWLAPLRALPARSQE